MQEPRKTGGATDDRLRYHPVRMDRAGETVTTRVPERSDWTDEAALSVAVLDPTREHHAFVADALSHRECIVAVYERSADLLAALLAGAVFDVVLATFPGDRQQAHAAEQIVRSIVGMPLLAMRTVEQQTLADALTAPTGRDFIVVPCSKYELMNCVAEFMRSTRMGTPDSEFTCGAYVFHPTARAVDVRGQRIKLKPREFALAAYLFRNEGIVHTRRALYNAVWKRASQLVGSRSLDVHVANLRLKLGLSFESGYELQCIRLVGYRLVIQ